MTCFRMLLWAASVVLVSFLSGCAMKPDFDEMPADAIYDYLVEQYTDEDYIDASEGFEYFILNYSGNAKIDSAQFLLARSFFEMKDYLIAADAFDEINRRFPSSPLVPEAMFMIGECYLEMSPNFAKDQEFTYMAIDAYQGFIDYFPELTDKVQKAQERIGQCRRKLGQKQYYNGVVYYKMKNYTAANIYLTGTIEQFYDTPWAAKALYYIGRSYQKNKDWDLALETYAGFLAKHPDHEWVDKVKRAQERTHKAKAKALKKAAENQAD